MSPCFAFELATARFYLRVLWKNREAVKCLSWRMTLNFSLANYTNEIIQLSAWQQKRPCWLMKAWWRLSGINANFDFSFVTIEWDFLFIFFPSFLTNLFPTLQTTVKTPLKMMTALRVMGDFLFFVPLLKLSLIPHVKISKSTPHPRRSIFIPKPAI